MTNVSIIPLDKPNSGQVLIWDSGGGEGVVSGRRLAPTTQLTERDYTGQKENLELGLLYYNARFYLPGIGRFASADTIVPDPGNPQQLNRYAYVLGNPIVFVDSSGHWAERNELGGWGSCYGNDACKGLWEAGGPTGGTCGYDCAFTFGRGGAREYSLAAVQADTERTIAVLQVVVAVAFEPADWAMTAYAWSQGDFHALDLLGLLPLIPASARRAYNVIDGGGDLARYATNAVGALCSFSEDTLVSTGDGLVPISEVELNDYVLAYNEKTGEIGYYPVVAIWAHEDRTIVYLTINGETVETTPEHPFYTVAGEWIPAAGLQPGDEIRAADWTSGTVETVQFSLQPQVMYNFTVAEAHTYFVGHDQWLVHNDCNPLAGLPRVGSANKTDPLHAFPDIVDNYAADAHRFSLNNGANLYQIEGYYSYYNRAGEWVTSDGIFEWIVDSDQVTHRVFIPGGTVTGLPNQWP
ncbi:MAG: hypothetical protein KJ063_24415 [Anaerolineae bacterium]|nr:hypothetical protein [Anaerolineae bacterium]